MSLHSQRTSRLTFAILILIAAATQTASADWRDDIGYTQLTNELGVATPTGAGVAVSMAEAPDASARYLPNTSGTNFTGKTVTNETASSTGFNSHASGVAGLFFGNTTSVAPGVTSVAAFEANSWINDALGLTTTTAPVAHPYSVQNHSWIANGTTAEIPEVIDAAKRVDYLANRDNVLIIGGANNGSTSSVPHLLAHSYNAINVGITNVERTVGNHSQGNTTLAGYGPGRPRPDIVAQAGVTSSSTPMVSSAAALLYEVAGSSNANNVEAMRAVLMAGATKDQFADWDRTATRPIDETFGAGELNVYNSYKILEGGEYNGTVIAPTSSVGLFGYDFNEPVSMSSSFLYQFDVPSGQVMDELSIFLQWSMDVVNASTIPMEFIPSTDPLLGGGLANLDLHFYDSNNSLVDQSISSVDNFEHIYLTGLSAGTYTLEVSGDRATEYGLAWRSSVSAVAVPEPSTFVTLAIFGGGLALRFRRRYHGRRA
ncbi:hypothetical protein Poly51_25400 [Rubripirellula tenax]|uniref:Peptidase S8/S53 domain-containing protein n=1 Tax=Rubripirellula tenax TaxID=2528015 RepID=A0A5C6F814_9BACT|nr:S8 family serine peptidase [Rubripirellula tenax]TWU56624.1 hypothetical protein Poly51_25400 [Rubripirellula tenax]